MSETESRTKEIYERYMDIALRLALKGKGRTSPNPMVGALVVKDNKIVGQGYHKKAGGPHAEVFALDEANDKAKGATLYVTLEPCSHFGRTPPCTERILESGIKEVVVAMRDPNPLNNRRGIRILKNHGLKVVLGICEDKAKGLNGVFIKYITQRLPFITVKVGQTLDGKIATKSGDSKWITAEVARKYAHNLRSQFDAILVGVNTIIKDNPLLNQTPNTKHQTPILKVIVDSKLRTPLNARLFSSNLPASVIIATTKNALKKRIALFCKKGIQIFVLPDKNGQVALGALMRKLAKMEITNVLVEGGGRIIGSLLEERLVDKILFFIAPKIIGGRDAISSVMGKGIDKVSKAIRLKDIKIKRLGEDILIEGSVSKSNQ
jgi:diaminohydroxyphosphoribosylaminopyrimidine deaminase/5-amino-6-(5-phosphoribosylamino)uracil reductase